MYLTSRIIGWTLLLTFTYSMLGVVVFFAGFLVLQDPSLQLDDKNVLSSIEAGAMAWRGPSEGTRTSCLIGVSIQCVSHHYRSESLPA